MLGHFELLNCLGQGSFGCVWKAKDTELDRTVAVKIPHADRMSSDDAEKFLREARAAAQVKHPNIVSIHEVGRENEQIYIASDFIEGASLDQWIEAQPPTVRETVVLCQKIAVALHQAHEAGVVHRDLKPQNILVDMSGEPHVTDFGLAKRDAGEVTMTVEGAILGTPAYMPPEQARGEAHKADRRSDVYSQGVILYRLLTGELPFRGRSQMLIVQILKDEPPSLRKLDARLPRDVETICLKCLQKNPDQRYQTSAELAADLLHWLVGEPITARPISAIERGWRWCRRKPALAGMWATAMLLLVTLGIGGSLFAVQQAKSATEQKNNAARQAELRDNAEAEREKAVLAAAVARLERNNAREAQLLADSRRSRALKAEHKAKAAEEKWRAEVIQKQAALKHAKKETDAARRNLNRAERNAYTSDMLLVQRNWEDANIGHLRELLDRHRDRDDVKGFEWGYWDRLAHSELLTLNGHTNGVFSVAFSPDGARLASASFDKTVRVWDAATGQQTLTLQGHTGFVLSVAFSPDGKRLASASADKTVRVWDAATGQETLTLEGHTSEVLSVSFSPDGTRLASASGDNFKSASGDKTVKLWDAFTGQETLTLNGHTNGVFSVAFSSDGKRLASASADQTVKVWDTATGQGTLTLKGHTETVLSVSFSPDGTRLASASYDKTVKVWDTATGQETLTLQGHTQPVYSVSFSPDGTRLASTSLDKTVKVWDAATGQEALTLEGHASRVNCVSFSSDGTRLASANRAQPSGVIVWDVATGQKTLTFNGNANGIEDVSFSPDGTRLATAGYRTVKVWDAATGQQTLFLKGHTGHVNGVSFSPDGTRLASAGADQTVKVWDTATGQGTLTLKGHISSVYSVAFSPDGTRLASAGGKTVKVWDAATGQETLTLKGHISSVYSVAFSPDGTRLASAGGKAVKVWDAATGQETLALKGHTRLFYSVAFSPDGMRLASTSFDGSVYVWDARPWTPELRAQIQARGLLTVHRDRVKSLEELQAYIRDDKTISDMVRKQALDWAELFWKNRQADHEQRD